MDRKSLVVVVALVSASFSTVQADLVVYSDDFHTNTTLSYTWVDEGVGGDGDPVNNYRYDSDNKWVTITTADNENIYIGASLPTAIEAGHFEFRFMPWKTYPTDGLVRMRLFGVDGRSYMYMWHFAHDSALSDAGWNDGYRAHLEKWVDGSAVIDETFIPTPSQYSLGEWHTLAMDFNPVSVSGYLDGELIRTEYDVTATPIAINSFEIVFQQQDQHLDDILITTQVVPVPGAVLLGTLGLGYAGMRLRRQAS